LSPVTFSSRAEAKLKNRTTPCKSWYLDLNLIGSYWGGGSGVPSHGTHLDELRFA